MFRVMWKLIIINALIWAAVILATAYFTNDHDNYQKLFGVLIVAAGFQNALLYEFLRKAKK